MVHMWSVLVQFPQGLKMWLWLPLVGPLCMSVGFCWSVVGLRSSLSSLIFCPTAPSSAGGVGTEMHECNGGFLHFSSQLHQFSIPVF